ncbi:MAG: nickel pincer cofactor biosynthesis protein LarC [Methanocella sp.]
MKTLYLNCFSGISGDMFLGAMLDLGVRHEALSSGLDALGIEGLKIEVVPVVKKGIKATHVDVIAPDTAEERHLAEILPIINDSDLPADVKRLSEAVFRRLGAAEAKVHGTTVNHVHFHEVGALDTIADVVGAAICLKEAGIEQVYASRVNVGSGKVRTSHGLLDVPAPATAELLRSLPTYSSDVKAELTTPTGAAILSEICKGTGPVPVMRAKKTGFGAGSRDLEIPNVLMAICGETDR